MKRTLVAGFGNELRGDDGFGVAVIRQLSREGFESDSVRLLEVGTGGIRLAQELLTPVDCLIILDASARGGRPGTVYTLQVDDVRATREIDLHTAVPSRALEVARALGALPSSVYLVGCEPASVDELTTELTPEVQTAIPTAVNAVRELLGVARGTGIAHEDELLELLYWFEGEGFAGAATLPSIARFTTLPEVLVRQTLDRLGARGQVLVHDGTGEYRLTENGRREAAQRFAEEFAPMLSQGHGECNDPTCDCHSSPNGAADCHAHRHEH